MSKGKKILEIGLSQAEQTVLNSLAAQKVQAEQGIIKTCDDIAISRGKDLKDKDVFWVVDGDKIIAHERKGE